MALLALTTLRESDAYPYSHIPTLNRADVGNTVTPPQLISKLLVQSPTLDNVYMDYLVTSKPLHLRKYNSKTKKNKKDSKIYFIPIPPLPYRYIPGIGYDYQPMKIKPIVEETASSSTDRNTHRNRPTVPTTAKPASSVTKQSKVFHVQHHKDYYFNGRPFRLQAAHADRKSALTSLNHKSRLYYNKNIIY